VDVVCRLQTPWLGQSEKRRGTVKRRGDPGSFISSLSLYQPCEWYGPIAKYKNQPARDGKKRKEDQALLLASPICFRDKLPSSPLNKKGDIAGRAGSSPPRPYKDDFRRGQRRGRGRPLLYKRRGHDRVPTSVGTQYPFVTKVRRPPEKTRTR